MRKTAMFVAAAVAAGLALPMTTASALPAAGAKAIAGVAVDSAARFEQVQWRRGGGWHRGGRGWGRGAGWGVGAGILGGAILGSALAAPYYYNRPYYYYPRTTYYGTYDGSDAVAYCSSRFRSYDPASGTYLGYDGLRHPCP